MLSVHRADYERATQPFSSGGGGTSFPGSRPVWVPHVRVGNRVFSHSLDVVFINYIYAYYLQSFLSQLISPLLFFLAVLPFVESCRTQCPCINGARSSYDTIKHVVNLPGKPMLTG